MRADALEAAMAADAARARTPFFVVATVGTTSTCAFDPLAAIGDIARRAGAWLHVDAAFAGSAAVCPELRWVHDGLEHADSYAFNPHKWLFTAFDCDCFYVADRTALIDALSITPEYLRNAASESGAVVDYRDWQIPLGRRFRALKLWFVIRHYGAEGLRHHVREHVRLAQDIAARIGGDDRFELVTATRLSLVCFAHRDGDAASERLLDALNASDRVYVTHTRVDDRFVIRIAIGSMWTDQARVDELWSLIDALA
jgi:aromatic-L-amino-acid decarboxylase